MKDKCNYGTFIGNVLDELQENQISDSIKNKEKKIMKEKYIKLDKYIENYFSYHNQNEDNFYKELEKLKNY